MKIGIDVQFLNNSYFTGAEVFGRGVLYGLNQVDSDNEYILYTDRMPVNIPFKLNKNFSFRIVSSFPFSSSHYWTQCRLPFSIVHDKIDRMLFTSHKTFLYWKPCASIASIYDLGFIYFPDMFEWNVRAKFKYITFGAVHRADHLIAISESTKENLCDYYGVPGNKISVIYPGLDTFLMQPDCMTKNSDILRRFEIGDKYLLYVGTLQPRKNIERMIEAFALYKDKFKNQVQLVIVGKKGWLYEKLISLMESREIYKKYIRWMDYVPDEVKWALYKYARCLVFPSLYEGFGIPALESMYFGTPVLYANRSSLPEVVGDGGIPFDPYDSKDIAQKIEQIMCDDKLHSSLKNRSLKQASRFTWEQSAQKIVNLFSDI